MSILQPTFPDTGEAYLHFLPKAGLGVQALKDPSNSAGSECSGTELDIVQYWKGTRWLLKATLQIGDHVGEALAAERLLQAIRHQGQAGGAYFSEIGAEDRLVAFIRAAA